MNKLHKWSLLLCLLIAALASYSYGFSQGAVGFVIVGAMLELIFWFKAFSSAKP